MSLCLQRAGIACVLACVLGWPLVLAGCGGRTINSTIDDATITARIKTVLLNDPQISATKIDVSTTNGVVTMSGIVPSKVQEERAVQLARQVSGVKEVRSELKTRN